MNIRRNVDEQVTTDATRPSNKISIHSGLLPKVADFESALGRYAALSPATTILIETFQYLIRRRI